MNRIKSTIAFTVAWFFLAAPAIGQEGFPPLGGEIVGQSNLFQVPRGTVSEFLQDVRPLEDLSRDYGSGSPDELQGVFLRRGFNPFEDSVCYTVCVEQDGEIVCYLVCGNESF